MSLSPREIAQALRNLDWAATMSDSPSVEATMTGRLGELRRAAEAAGVVALVDAAARFESQVTWVTWDEPTRNDAEIKRYTGISRAERIGQGAAWVAEYLRAFGVPDADEVAPNLVGGEGERTWNVHFPNWTWSATGAPKWDVIDRLVAREGA